MTIYNSNHPCHPVLGGLWESSSARKWFAADLIDDDDDELVRHASRATTRDEFRVLMAIRRAKAVNTYQYDGDLFDNIMGQGNNPQKWWSALTVHERERRLFSEFRMPEQAFEDLLQQVGPSIRVKNSYNPKYRTYCARSKLLMTINYLAYCPTLRRRLRFGAQQWGVPHNTMWKIIEDTIDAILDVLFYKEETKVVRFPEFTGSNMPPRSANIIPYMSTLRVVSHRTVHE